MRRYGQPLSPQAQDTHRRLCHLVEDAQGLAARLNRYDSLTDRACQLRLMAAARLGRRVAALIAFRKAEGLWK